MSVQLFTYKTNGVNTIKAVKVAANIVGVEVASTELAPSEVGSARVKAQTPFGKFPYLIANNVSIYDGAAMLAYIAGLRTDLNLNGATPAEEAIVSQWLNITLKEVVASLESLNGGSYGDKIAKFKDILGFFKTIDDHFIYHTYVAGNTFTVADILLAITLVPTFTDLFGPFAQESLPNLTRFFLTAVHHPKVAAAVGTVELCQKDQYVELAKAFVAPVDHAPKKVKKELAEIDALPKSSMKIDDVKREWCLERPFNPNFFDKETGLWSYFDKEGYSCYTIEYMYPEDWTKEYIAYNQIDGFINRCEGAKKYAFMVLNAYFKDGYVHAKGGLIFRGQDIYTDYMGPDLEEYKTQKVNIDDDAERAAFEALLCADKIDGCDIDSRRTLK